LSREKKGTQRRNAVAIELYSDERGEALEHLEFALEEFREMKMQPYAEKAQALRDKL